jgi:hypothetical protein
MPPARYLAFGACVAVGIVFIRRHGDPAADADLGVSRPYRLFSAMSPALVTAFSTASSAATLPLSLECLDKRANVSERIASFVMPLGTSINHVGSALYECAGAMFLCQAYGLHLTFGAQFTVVTLALMTSMGIAGIPAASLVAIAVILAAVGLPPRASACCWFWTAFSTWPAARSPSLPMRPAPSLSRASRARKTSSTPADTTSGFAWCSTARIHHANPHAISNAVLFGGI